MIRNRLILNRFKAFTLVELLVVVGIIALLIAILLPALNRARQAGKAAACLANMRDLANAVANYEANNKGRLEIGDGVTVSMAGRGYCPAITDYVDPGQTASPPPGQVVGVISAIVTGSYSWNPWIMLAQTPYQWNSMNPGASLLCNPSSIPDTSEVVLAADVISTVSTGFEVDGGSSGLHDPYYEFEPAGLRLCKPVFHGRHGGRGSVLWLDGHASLVAAAAVPLTTPWNAANSSGPQHPPQYYNQNHIGYLVRSENDLGSMAADYYFVYKKEPLGANNYMLYCDANKSLWR